MTFTVKGLVRCFTTLTRFFWCFGDKDGEGNSSKTGPVTCEISNCNCCEPESNTIPLKTSWSSLQKPACLLQFKKKKSNSKYLATEWKGALRWLFSRDNFYLTRHFIARPNQQAPFAETRRFYWKPKTNKNSSEPYWFSLSIVRTFFSFFFTLVKRNSLSLMWRHQKTNARRITADIGEAIFRVMVRFRSF